MAIDRPAIKRVATLDLLRLASALAVVFFHYLFRGAAAHGYLDAGFPHAIPFAIYGYLGVIQFFLISGFVIAWSAEGRRFEEFAVARFARIYPGFLTCMTITFVTVALFGLPRFETSLSQYAANLLMFSPALGQPFMDGVYWSIILEVIFYGWITIALIFGIFEKWKFLLLSVWLAVIAANELVIGSGVARMIFLTEYGPFFISGIIIHHLFAHGRSNIALALIAGSFAASCVTLQIGRVWMLDHYGQALSVPALIVANLFMHGLMIAAVRWRDIVRPSHTILLLGGLTYPLYLLHQNIGYIGINTIAPSVGAETAVLIMVMVMLVTSWAVWRFIETPSRRWIIRTVQPVVSRFVYRKHTRSPVQPAE